MSATVLTISQLGADVIRQQAQPVENVCSSEMQELADNLIKTCKQAGGMGIAAPQVSVSKRVFIMSSHPNERYSNAPLMKPTAVYNPKITWRSEEMEKDWEGCLSLPGVRAKVKRHQKIRVNYLDEKGTLVKAEFCGFLARLFQHELDHLDGKVFIDRADPLDIVMEQEYQRLISIADDQHSL